VDKQHNNTWWLAYTNELCKSSCTERGITTTSFEMNNITIGIDICCSYRLTKTGADIIEKIQNRKNKGSRRFKIGDEKGMMHET